MLSILSRQTKQITALSSIISPACCSVFKKPTSHFPCENTQVRNSSGFFSRYPASQLWDSVMSVSNAGRKRGRGKGKGKYAIKDLNKGQIIGIGDANIRWPGLSAPIIRGRELVKRQQLPPDSTLSEDINRLRDTMGKNRRQRLAPIDRGWTGGHAAGRKVGPPDPIGDYNFDGFQSIILDHKQVAHMTGRFGRQRVWRSVVITGNGNGLIGCSMVSSGEAKSALNRARNKAGQRLAYVERYEDRTVLHDFFTHFGKTKIYVHKKGPGYGLRCHRVIKAMCELLGIKDLHCKVEGGTKAFSIYNAFLIGLLKQKSFDELANETGLHVVEMSEATNFFPKVVGSPKNPIEKADEVPDFQQYLFDDKIIYKKKKFPPSFTKRRYHPVNVRRHENLRSHFNTKIQLIAKHGELRSFLADIYPDECRAAMPRWTTKERLQIVELAKKGVDTI